MLVLVLCSVCPAISYFAVILYGGSGSSGIRDADGGVRRDVRMTQEDV